MKIREDYILWNFGDGRSFQKVGKEGVALPWIPIYILKISDMITINIVFGFSASYFCFFRPYLYILYSLHYECYIISL